MLESHQPKSVTRDCTLKHSNTAMLNTGYISVTTAHLFGNLIVFNMYYDSVDMSDFLVSLRLFIVCQILSMIDLDHCKVVWWKATQGEAGVSQNST